MCSSTVFGHVHMYNVTGLSVRMSGRFCHSLPVCAIPLHHDHSAWQQWWFHWQLAPQLHSCDITMHTVPPSSSVYTLHSRRVHCQLYGMALNATGYCVQLRHSR